MGTLRSLAYRLYISFIDFGSRALRPFKNFYTEDPEIIVGPEGYKEPGGLKSFQGPKTAWGLEGFQ